MTTNRTRRINEITKLLTGLPDIAFVFTPDHLQIWGERAMMGHSLELLGLRMIDVRDCGDDHVEADVVNKLGHLVGSVTLDEESGDITLSTRPPTRRLVTG